MPASPHDIITIQNISENDFTFEYNRSEGNYPYLIKAGEIKRFPRFLAAHAVKHLIDQVLNERKQKTNNQTLRQALAEQIIVEEEVFQQEPKRTEADKTKELVDKLNVPSELDSILKKRQGKEQPKSEIETTQRMAPVATVEEPEEFEGLKVQGQQAVPDLPREVKTKPEPSPVVAPNKLSDQPAPVSVVSEDKPAVIPLPSRKELYEYAETDMRVKLNDKMIKRFDGMKVSELIKELRYPLEDLVNA